MTVNRAILVGNLGRDPELRHTNSGTPVCEFSIATSERYKTGDGEAKERTEWHRIIVWGKQGENAARFLSKGRQVYVEGRIQYRDYEDKQGNKRTTTEIVANSVQFLSGSGDGKPRSGESRGGGAQGGGSFSDDQIPF